jgi:hypothetical protein
MATKVKTETADKTLSETFDDLQTLKEQLVKKATMLNQTLEKYTGVPQTLPEDKTVGSCCVLAFLEHIENLRYSCESINSDIHNHKEDVRVRMKAIQDYL